MHLLRTLDVWDTLLRRRCHPDVIKLIACQHLLLGFADKLQSIYHNPWILLRERCQVEGDLAHNATLSGTDDEYLLDDVLQQLIQRAWIAGQAIPSDLIENLIEFEITLEISSSYADDGIIEFLNDYPAERTIFLSDFYMPAQSISRILREKGLHSIVSVGHSSCDVGLNKRSGNLFRHIYANYLIHPKNHLHIGDNTYSDVEVPRQLGARSIEYRPYHATEKRILLDQMFQDRSSLHKWISQKTLASLDNHSQSAEIKTHAIRQLGVEAAPLIIGFCLDVAEQSLINRSECIAFFTREGEFFKAVFEVLFPKGFLAGHQLAPTTLFEVSRLSTFCASLREVSINEMMRVWNLYSTQSMHGLISTLGLDPGAIISIIQNHGLDLYTSIQYPWRDERVIALFADPKFLALVYEKRDKDQELLRHYLIGKGLSMSTKSIQIVDVGWRGTIQDNLAFLFPQTLFYGEYLGLSKFLNEQPSNTVKRAYGPDLNLVDDMAHLLDSVSPIEMLCNSPNGSTVGYSISSDLKPSAIRAVDAAENSVFDCFTSEFQQGVLEAARLWSKYIEEHGITAIELRDEACSVWNQLISQSPKAMAEAYASLRHNETFGVGGFIYQGETILLRHVLAAPFKTNSRKRVFQYILSRPWRNALWRRNDLSLHKRVILVCLLMLADAVREPYKLIKRWKTD